jgi:4-amino-4-deoxy-L-arabinose transferase-like glycosyltransferase
MSILTDRAPHASLPVPDAGGARTRSIQLSHPEAVTALVLLVLMGLSLRLFGINYPGAFYPDEAANVATAARMAATGRFIPEAYDHASGYMTILGFIYAIASAFGETAVRATGALDLNEVKLNPPASLYFIARVLTVLASATNLVLVYCLGRTLYSVRAGLIAAGLLAITPLDVWEAHFATESHLGIMFVLLGLLFTVRLARGESLHVAAGVCAGLAQATRYIGGFLCLGIVVAHLTRNWSLRNQPWSPWRDIPPPRLLAHVGAAMVGVGLFYLAVGEWTGFTFRNFMKSTGTLENLVYRTPLSPPYKAVSPLLTDVPVERLSLLGGVGLIAAAVLAYRWPFLQPVMFRDSRKLALAAVASAVMFAVGMPAVLLDSDLFMKHLGIYSAHQYEPHYGFDRTPAGWNFLPVVYQLTVGLPFGLGIGLYVLSLVSIVAALVRPRAGEIVILSVLTCYLVVIGIMNVAFLRYLLPLAPFLCIFSGGFVDRLLHERWNRVLRVAALSCTAVAIIYTMAFTLSSGSRFIADTRLEAARWIEREIPSGSVLGLTTITEYSPYVDREMYGVMVYDRALKSWWLRPSELPKPDYVVLTSLNYLRAARDPIRFDVYLTSFCRLWSGATPWVLRSRFESTYLHKDFYSALDPMFASYYVSPTIEIYERQAASQPYPTPDCD